jgi:hypothetical protein
MLASPGELRYDSYIETTNPTRSNKMSFFIMKMFTGIIVHMEAANLEDAQSYMLEEYGTEWAQEYMLFEAKRVYND